MISIKSKSGFIVDLSSTQSSPVLQVLDERVQHGNYGDINTEICELSQNLGKD